MTAPPVLGKLTVYPKAYGVDPENWTGQRVLLKWNNA